MRHPLSVINITLPVLEKKPELLDSVYGHHLNVTRNTPIRPISHHHAHGKHDHNHNMHSVSEKDSKTFEKENEGSPKESEDTAKEKPDEENKTVEDTEDTKNTDNEDRNKPDGSDDPEKPEKLSDSEQSDNEKHDTKEKTEKKKDDDTEKVVKPKTDGSGKEEKDKDEPEKPDKEKPDVSEEGKKESEKEDKEEPDDAENSEKETSDTSKSSKTSNETKTVNAEDSKITKKVNKAELKAPNDKVSLLNSTDGLLKNSTLSAKNTSNISSENKNATADNLQKRTAYNVSTVSDNTIPTPCFNASDVNKTTICRTKLSDPQTSQTQFQGNIGISETGLKGKAKQLGNEELSAFNETSNFHVGKNSTYNFQNLTDIHKCDGCLEGKHLIKHNETFPVLKEKEEVKNKSLEDEKSQFVKNSTGYFKSKEDKIDIASALPKLDNKRKNKNDTSSAIYSDDLKNETSSNLNDTFDWENKLFRRRCDPVEITTRDSNRTFLLHRNRSISGIYTNCITKRRLVSNKVTHTKTKKNGKVVSDTTKDENEEKKKNSDRARENQERAKENEQRVHQSEANDRENQEKAAANEKVLQEILRGDHGKPAAQITEEESRNYENLTAKLDPSMIPDNRTDPPPEDRKDEDVGMIGMDPRPAIEENKSSAKQQNGRKEDFKNSTKVSNSNSSKNKTDNLSSNLQNNNSSTDNLHKSSTPNKSTGDNKNQQNNTNVNTTVNAKNITAKNPIDDDLYTDDKPTKSILAFGDSLTKGLYGVDRYNPYTIHLQELLQEDNNKNNDVKKERYAVYNEGVNGECACGEMTKRLPATLDRYNDQKKKIDLVIILGGTNDLLRSQCAKKCDIFENIKQLHKTVHDRQMKSVVVTILKVTVGNVRMTDKEYEDMLWDINQELRGFVKENPQKMTLCDLADEFPRKAALSVDKVHPTKEGYDKIAEIVFDCIKDFKY